MAITILKNKGKILSALAAVKLPKVRKLLGLVFGLSTAGKLKSLDDISGNKEIMSLISTFNVQEMTIYKKHLVPLGFPIFRKGDIKEIGAETFVKVEDVGISDQKEVMETLEEHIDYLQEESFFQKAHKDAKDLNIIDRSESARQFYHDYAINYGTGFTYTNMLKEGGRRRGIVRRGKMMFFRYRPDEIKSTYDLYPLIFVLDRQKDYFDGINFHYLMPKLRAVALGEMFTYLSNLNFDISTRLNFRQFVNIVDKNKRFKFAKQALRRYNYKNIISKIIEVHPLDWELAIMLNTEKFYDEQRAKTPSVRIWKDTRLKALTN